MLRHAVPEEIPRLNRQRKLDENADSAASAGGSLYPLLNANRRATYAATLCQTKRWLTCDLEVPSSLSPSLSEREIRSVRRPSICRRVLVLSARTGARQRQDRSMSSAMRISDVNCPSCAASYELAESISTTGNPGRAQCSICGNLIASWQEPKLRAYRLVMTPERKYSNVPVPPPPGR
jgi:hypothetical protein